MNDAAQAGAQPGTEPGAESRPDHRDHLELPFPFLRTNPRTPKPRTRGVTEIRGPYYTPVGLSYLRDLLETWGTYVDALKFAG